MAGTIRFGDNTDHQLNQALNMLAQSRSLSVSGLGASQAGLFAYNTGRLYVLNAAGTAFELKATDSDLLGGQNSAYHLARANQTGTQLASTISNFDTQVRTNSLDQMTAAAADVNINSHKLTNVTDGVSAQDAVTVSQLNAVAQGLDFKASVRAASTANGALATAFENADVLDGVTLATGDRILLKNQTTATENGIYVVAASGAPARAADANATGELSGGSLVTVDEGTTNADTMWMLTTNGNIIFGTTNQVWAQFGAGGAAYTAGNGLTLTGNDFNVGAGTGIIANANDVAIDPAVVARVVTGTIPSGGSPSVNIAHNLGLGANKNIGYLAVIERSSGDEVKFGWTRVDGNTVSIVLPANPTANQWDWTVIG